MDALYSTALGMTGKPAAAEDLVQEAALRAYERFEQFERGTNFKAWILTVMTRIFINQVRRRRLEPVLHDFTDRDAAPAEIEVPRFTLEEAHKLRDKLDKPLASALAKMPEPLRVVLFLSTLEDLKYAEIADAVGSPVGTVMSRLFRARHLLRQELAAYAVDAGFQRGANR